MSRIDDYEPDDTKSFLRSCAFQHNIEQALKGKKGQKFLRELEATLLAMPEKRLVAGTLVREPVALDGGFEIEGDRCALGSVLVQRKVAAGKTETQAFQEIAKAVHKIEHPDYETGWDMIKLAAKLLGISTPLAYAIVYENDEGRAHYTGERETPEERYHKVLKWAQDRLYRYSGWYHWRPENGRF